MEWPSSDNKRLGPLSIMSLREVYQELEREEDCDNEPATREGCNNEPATRDDCDNEDLHVARMTSDYGTAEGGAMNMQRSLDCQDHGQCQQRRSLMVQHPSTVTIGMARSQSTFQPPALCQDCGL